MIIFIILKKVQYRCCTP